MRRVTSQYSNKNSKTCQICIYLFQDQSYKKKVNVNCRPGQPAARGHFLGHTMRFRNFHIISKDVI